jgi:SAM-dependent methyltransferase
MFAKPKTSDARGLGIGVLIRRAHWFFSTQVGIDLRKMVRCLMALPRYVSDLVRFRSNYAGRLTLMPCLHDWSEEGGTTKSEYFWQDLFVARLIYDAKPEKHVDVGSRVDGFVAHVASFREIEVFDIRPITTRIPGVSFRQADLMHPNAAIMDYCDSLSCLHALEHFGLGRYGDSLDTKGYEVGIRSMARILRTGGLFYLSVPVGVERVEFNAHRVFDPRTIVSVARACHLLLRGLALFSSEGGLVETDATEETLSSIGRNAYGLGIFTFVKST